MKLKTLLSLIPTWWPRWLRVTAGVIVFVAFAAVALDNWHQLTDFSWHLDVAPLAVSACILLITYYLDILGWHRIVTCLGSTCPFGNTARIWLYSNLARYLPGSLWYAAGRVVLGNDAGVSPTMTSVGLVLEVAFLIISHALVIIITWPLWTSYTLPEIPLLWLGSVQTFLSVVLIIGALSIVHPRGLKWFFTQYQRLRVRVQTSSARRREDEGRMIDGEERTAFVVRLKYRDTLQILAIYVGQALLVGTAFYFLARSLVPLPLNLIPSFVGAFVLAWLIGFVSLFAPGGLGVREGVLVYLLGPVVTEPIAIMIAILARAWLVAGELLCVALARLTESRERNQVLSKHLVSEPGRSDVIRESR